MILLQLACLILVCFSQNDPTFYNIMNSYADLHYFPWDFEIKYPGENPKAQFAKGVSNPAELHVLGNFLYVACFRTDQVLRLLIQNDGTLAFQPPEIFAEGFYCLHGPRDCARLAAPWGLESDGEEILFVSSFGGDTVMKFNARTGDYLGSVGSSEQLDGPEGLAFDSETNLLFVSSYLSHQIVAFDIKSGLPEYSFSSPYLDHPQGMVLSHSQELFVCSSQNDSVNVFQRNGTLIDVLTQEKLTFPVGIALDSMQNIAVTSYKKKRITLFDAESLSYVGTIDLKIPAVMGISARNDEHFMPIFYLASYNLGDIILLNVTTTFSRQPPIHPL